MLILAGKYMGAGLATCSLAGSGVGMGMVFGSLMNSMSSNPAGENKYFLFAVLGFALCESVGLFGLMMSFLILFG